MRAAALALLASLVACACEPSAKDPTPMKQESLPDWSGPPLQVQTLADGGIALELLAPTANHSFVVAAVDTAPGTATIRMLHTTPGDAFVAQVITPLRATVEAGRLGGARRIDVRIATKAGPKAQAGAERLAFVLLRP